jgi:hypothetical protein
MWRFFINNTISKDQNSAAREYAFIGLRSEMPLWHLKRRHTPILGGMCVSGP